MKTYNNEPDYLGEGMTLDQAAAIRWALGRKRYGGTVFRGDELREAAQEAPDLRNYAVAAMQNGADPGTCRQIVEHAQAAYRLLLELFRDREESDLAGRFVARLTE